MEKPDKSAEPSKNDADSPELLESNFSFHDFTDSVGEIRFTCQIMEMQDSYFVYIGDSNNGTMDNMTYAFLSTFDKLPVSTRLMGQLEHPHSGPIASKLAKLTRTPVYVSFNINLPDRMGIKVQQRVIEEFKTHVLNSTNS